MLSTFLHKKKVDHNIYISTLWPLASDRLQKRNFFHCNFLSIVRLQKAFLNFRKVFLSHNSWCIYSCRPFVDFCLKNIFFLWQWNVNAFSFSVLKLTTFPFAEKKPTLFCWRQSKYFLNSLYLMVETWSWNTTTCQFFSTLSFFFSPSYFFFAWNESIYLRKNPKGYFFKNEK